MNIQQRNKDIYNQKRSFMCGTIEYINEQWVFFEAEEDEAFLLFEIAEDGLEIYLSDEWVPAVLLESGELYLHTLHTYEMNNGDAVRIRKKLPFAYMELLQELPEDAFLQFTKLLNSINISLYDNVYCHNTLYFLPANRRKEGVNFIVYDNGTFICSVQHYFERGKNQSDWFEYTLQTGKRLLFTKMEQRKAE
ncbi:DUF2777 domain-containing protein [Sutcliffiella cohnii]